MSVLTAISGVVFLVSGFVMAVSIVMGSLGAGKTEGITEHDHVKVGSIYASSNPGKSNDPREKPRPFVSIATAVETVGKSVRCDMKTMFIDGATSSYESWIEEKDLERGSMYTNISAEKEARE